MPAPERPPITGIAEIVLSVADLPKMRDFYVSVMGFSLQSEACHDQGTEATPGGKPTISFLVMRESTTPLGRHGHPEMLVLIDYRRHVFAKARFKGHDIDRSTLNHLAFEIPPDTYDAHEERLQQMGLAPRRVVFPAMSARALFFEDPEGNELELICHDARQSQPPP